MTSGRMGSSAVRAAPISVPGSIRPVSSMVTWTWIGTRRPAATMARLAGVDGGLGLEEVVDRLDEQQVDPAGEEGGGLLLVGVAQLEVGDLAEGGEAGAGAEVARHPARPPSVAEAADSAWSAASRARRAAAG